MITRWWVFYVGVLVTLLLSSCPLQGKENAEEQSRPLLKTAADRSLLHADGNSPIKLKLSFTLSGSRSRAKGTYTWFVSNAGDWRKEVAFSDYSNVEVGRGSTVWVKRNLDFNPREAAWLEGIFSNHQYLNIPEDTIGKYFTTSEHHVQLRCVDLFRYKKPRTLCFDPQDNLVKAAVGELNITFEYSDYRPAGQKFAPHKIVLKRDGKTVLEAEVEDLSMDNNVDLHLFEPPAGAIKRGGCFTPTLPRPTKTAFPKYPPMALAMRDEGTVMMYVLIASDGTVHNPQVIETAEKELDEASLRVIPAWQFEPARCGDRPVDFETTIGLNFSLQPR